MHLGLIGYGNIARTLLDLLAVEPVDKLILLVRPGALVDARRALQACEGAGDVSVVDSVEDLIAAAPDVVAECAGQEAARTFGPPLLAAGLPTIIVSIGAFADEPTARALEDAAIAGGSQVILPAGAIGGIDLLAAISKADDLSVTYRGTKPAAAWKGTPAERVTDLDHLSAPETVFTGSARAAARDFPKNANVAATLAMAGAGFERTRVTLIADPDARGNKHAFEARSALGAFSVEIENAASSGNAKTSVATVYSLLREINRFRSPVVV